MPPHAQAEKPSVVMGNDAGRTEVCEPVTGSEEPAGATAASSTVTVGGGSCPNPDTSCQDWEGLHNDPKLSEDYKELEDDIHQ